MEEGPNPILIILAIVVVAAVITTWTQEGGFNHLLKEGERGSLFTVKPIQRDTTSTNEWRPGSQTGTNRPVLSTQIARGDQVYNKSPYYGQVKLSRGSAGSAAQPNDEYVSLSTFNLKTPVNITGWSLKNGKDLKLFKVSGDLVRYRSDVAVIGKGTKVFNQKGQGNLEDIYLKAGDKAIITTGGFYGIDPIPVRLSFKTNLCTGYLESLPYYNFRPNLPLDCPAPAKELGVNYLEEDCYRYLKSVPKCFTPEFDAVKRVGNNDEYRDVLKNGPLLLSSSCKKILRENFSYQSCLDVHANDPNFEGKEWRIVLGRLMPMYDRTREVITLFDREGKVVDQISY